MEVIKEVSYGMKLKSLDLRSFDLPLIYIHGESFNQPILGCNNLAGKVWPVHADGGPSGNFPPVQFKLYFANGGVGTFLRLFGNYMRQIKSIPATPVIPTAPPADLVAQA